MNFDAFPSWEKEFERQQNEKAENRRLFMIQKFNETYPELNFGDLQKQRDGVFTNDRSTHYRHKITEQVYSWEYGNLYWYKSQRPLTGLFN